MTFIISFITGSNNSGQANLSVGPSIYWYLSQKSAMRSHSNKIIYIYILNQNEKAVWYNVQFQNVQHHI
jgi:hypothetical protein